MKTKVISTHSHHWKEVAPMNHDHFIVPPGKKIRLKNYDPGFTSHHKNKDEASRKLQETLQDVFQK